MSRYYEITVVVTEYKPSKAVAIKEAIEQEWNFTDWCEYDNRLTSSADGNLCGGESEYDFAVRLAKVAWQANSGFCEISVRSTFLEDLPYEEHCFDEQHYRRLVGEHVESFRSGRINGAKP